VPWSRSKCATRCRNQAARRAATWQLLARTPLQNGGDAARARSQHATEVRARLRDLGISKSRWQALAAVPEPVFDDFIAGAREKGRRDGSTELTTAGALTVARQYRPPYKAASFDAPIVLLAGRDWFDVADATALPWPDNSVDLLVTSPPYALDIEYLGGDVQSYAEWLQLLDKWLREMSRVSRVNGGRLCLNVPLDRDLKGWEPVSADVLQTARANGWRFRTWLIWDKGQAGAGTDRGSVDSASAPNVTAGVWRCPGTTDPFCAAPFPESYRAAASPCLASRAMLSPIPSVGAGPRSGSLPGSDGRPGRPIAIRIASPERVYASLTSANRMSKRVSWAFRDSNRRLGTHKACTSPPPNADQDRCPL
jgi:hypothetical protein